MNPRSAFVGCPSVVCSSSGSAKNARYARLLPSTRKSSESRAGPSSRTSSSPVSVFGAHRRKLSSPVPCAGVPLLSGSRIVTVPVGADDVILRPPPPARPVWSTWQLRCARRCAYPARRRIARRDRAPESSGQRRRRASRAPTPRRTGRSASGCARDRSRRAREARRRGRTTSRSSSRAASHEGVGGRSSRAPAPSPGARISRSGRRPRRSGCRSRRASADESRINAAVVDADLVLVVSSAETVVHGGPGALLAACDAATVRRAAAARSLVQASGEPVWRAGARHRGGRRRRESRFSASRLSSTTRDSRDGSAATRTTRRRSSTSRRSPFRRLYSAAARRRASRHPERPDARHRDDGGLRRPAVRRARRGARSCSRASRNATRRATRRDGRGVPWAGAHFPREPLNPITSAAVVLGLALRQWRDAFPIREGGTVVLVHSLTRSVRPRDAGSVSHALRHPADRRRRMLAEAETSAASDQRALRAYRDGRACHPLLPYADWAGCQPALARLGRVIVAGSRDAIAARTLGFVPSHSVASGLEMAHGVAGGRARVGVLLAPPYAPLCWSG